MSKKLQSPDQHKLEIQKLETKMLETKAFANASDASIDGMFGDFMSAFEEFKATNDNRLDELEKRGSSDGLLHDKIDRLNKFMDGKKSAYGQKALEQARPQLEAGRPNVMGIEQKEAFAAYMKRGETKALSAGSNPDGGYLIPDGTASEITRLQTMVSPIREISGVRQISTSVYKKPVSTTGFSAAWVGETTARPETNSTTLAEVSFPTMELYAMPSATASFLEDAAVDVEQWISGEVNQAFAEQETSAFINGDGVNKPNGFLDATQVAESSWSWGNIGYVPTGVSGDFPATDESDVLIDLVYSLKAGYRQNSHWVMNRQTQGVIRKLKDADGNYLWQPALAPNAKPTLLGFGVVEAEDMPDIAAGETPIAFGDFNRGYLVVDRQGVNVLRDPFSAKPYVLFYTTKRVGGGVHDFDAIKLLKFSAS